MKRCTKCKSYKPTTEFHKTTYQKSGLKPSCKACVSVESRRYYAENAEVIKARTSAWSKANESKVKSYKARRYLADSEIVKLRSRRWAKNNAEKRRQIAAKSDSKHRVQRAASARRRYWKDVERAREEVRRNQALRRASGSVPIEWWHAISDVIETGACIYCGTPGQKLTIDHWVPVSRGGKTEIGNLVPCCKTCNSKKGSLAPKEWLAKIKADDEGDTSLTIEQFLKCAQEAYSEWLTEGMEASGDGS